MPTTTVGTDFRHTVGFVSEPSANYVCEQDSTGGNSSAPFHDYPPGISFGGTTLGLEQGNWVSFADRNAGIDARLAGVWISAAVSSFRVDLPNGPGVYGIQVALGDANNAISNLQLEIFDDAASLSGSGGLITGSTSAASHFIAANGTEYTSAANWAAANTLDGGGAAQMNFTFVSNPTIARFKIGNGSNNTALAHVFITGPTGGGGGTVVLMGQASLISREEEYEGHESGLLIPKRGERCL